MEHHHARYLQCEWPLKIPNLLSFTPLPFHSDHILMLKIGPQSGRVQVLELTFGQKKKKKSIHWSNCEERKMEFLLDYFTGLWGLLVTTVSGYLWLTLGLITYSRTPSMMAVESTARRTSIVSLPEITRNFLSHFGESSDQRPCLSHLWTPGCPTPPDPQNRS